MKVVSPIDGRVLTRVAGRGRRGHGGLDSRNSGRVCGAGSRVLIEAPIHDEFVAAVSKAVEAIRVGDPLDLGTAIDAVSSEVQLNANLGFVETAKQEGG